MADENQIHRGRKFDQVLEGARTIFLRDGFEGASVDDIAKEAGVSKATLYSYFPDKRLMFVEVVRSQLKEQTDSAVASIDFSAAPEEVLSLAASQLVESMTCEPNQGLFRLCVAESERFPELGRAFYAAGPALVHELLMKYLHGAVGRGELVVDDVDLAAYLFMELCKSELHPKLLFGVGDCCSAAQKERVIKGAVEMFLARYAAKRG